MECPPRCRGCRILQAACSRNLGELKMYSLKFDYGDGLKRTFASLKDDGDRTALHCAAAGGQREICSYLVHQIELDVNLRAGNGYTPLHCAIAGGHFLTARYLVWIGADISLSDNYGFTALHLAADRGHTGIMELLISKGASTDLITDSNTPLHVAAAKGKADAVQVLLNHYANPNLIGHDLCTPLFMSIVAGSLECLLLLLKARADPNINLRGETLLNLAVEVPHAGMVDYLLKYRADPNATGSSGLTPLEHAALNHDNEIMRMLFPVTARIPPYPDWSIQGIVEHIHSQEATEQRAERDFQLRTEKLKLCREKGKDAFKEKNYATATSWYNEAITINPSDETLFSNRSLCWVRLNEGKKALSDAMDCVKLKPDWPKAHYREGAAYKVLKNYQKAAEAFEKALELDPHSKETEKELQEVLKMASQETGHAYWNAQNV